MCTFIANDLEDIEKDRVNHPERPLPSGDITLSSAGALYFVCLAFALLTTRIFIRAEEAFLYYTLLVMTISYGYFVTCFPGFKALYVAAAISSPIMIVATLYPAEAKLYLVAASAFFFAWGRELCMDFVDRPGDVVSFMHGVKPRQLFLIAFSSHAIGFLLLASQAEEFLDLVDLLLILSLLILAGVYWFKLANYKKAIFVMKMQFLVGLYFLI